LVAVVLVALLAAMAATMAPMMTTTAMRMYNQVRERRPPRRFWSSWRERLGAGPSPPTPLPEVLPMWGSDGGWSSGIEGAD
jgi:hypothetical protein